MQQNYDRLYKNKYIWYAIFPLRVLQSLRTSEMIRFPWPQVRTGAISRRYGTGSSFFAAEYGRSCCGWEESGLPTSMKNQGWDSSSSENQSSKAPHSSLSVSCRWKSSVKYLAVNSVVMTKRMNVGSVYGFPVRVGLLPVHLGNWYQHFI